MKGLVGLNIEVEKSFSWRGDSFHGVWAPLKAIFLSIVLWEVLKGASMDSLGEACDYG